MVGAGVLGLPYAFRRAGLALGAGFLVAVAAAALYCMLLLVSCKRCGTPLLPEKVARRFCRHCGALSHTQPCVSTKKIRDHCIAPVSRNNLHPEEWDPEIAAV